MPIPRRKFYSVWIIPPPSIFPRLRLLSDQVRCISKQISVPDVPHVGITGVIVDDNNDRDVVQAWLATLKAAIAVQKPFKLELGKPIKMQAHDVFPDNVSFPVPIIDGNFQALSDLVIDITHKYFPRVTKRGLSPQTDHMCIAENIPDHLKGRVAAEVAKFSSTISFDVDRIWVATIEEEKVLREPFHFATRIEDEDVHSFIPDEAEAQWLLATMYMHQKPFDSRLRMQKVMFLEDQEMAKSYYHFVPNRLGPHSHYLQDWCDRLVSAGLVYETEDYVIGLTPLGEKVAATCFGFLDGDVRLRLVKWMKENGAKSTSELLNYVHFEYPQYHVLERHGPDD